MKYNKIYPLFTAVILLLGVTSCKKELAKINKNPNAVEDPQPAYLLSGAVASTAQAYWNVNESNPTNLFVQYWAAIQYTEEDRYIFTSSSFQDLWDALYQGSIVNLDKIISLAKENENTNYQGVALVLRSWNFCLLTDAFGDVPYSQAIQIDEHIDTKYDKQEEVYHGILKDLKKAQTLLDPNGEAIQGDIIYNNDISLWKKFDNALRLRIALRIADRQPDSAKAVLTDITQAGNNYISSNDETAEVVFDGAPNDNPLYEAFLTRQDYRISKTIVDQLFQLNDPRLPIYAAPTEDPTPATYVGIPNGLLAGDASALGISKTSQPGDYFLDENAPAVIMSYSEVLFDRAEAAARDLTQENAAQLYKKAITASLEQYGIDQNAINTYLAQSDVQFNKNNYKKSIGVQKWIALFGQGLEAFAEWRRLDYPQLQPAVAGVLNGEMPSRIIYPGTEQSLNKEGYQGAIENQGPDKLTTKLWFDTH